MRLSCSLHLSGWVAAKSVRLYVDKNYRYHYLAMLGHDLPENLSLETMSGRKRKEQDLKGDWEAEEEEEGGMSSSGEMEGTPEDGKGWDWWQSHTCMLLTYLTTSSTSHSRPWGPSPFRVLAKRSGCGKCW